MVYSRLFSTVYYVFVLIYINVKIVRDTIENTYRGHKKPHGTLSTAPASTILASRTLPLSPSIFKYPYVLNLFPKYPNYRSIPLSPLVYGMDMKEWHFLYLQASGLPRRSFILYDPSPLNRIACHKSLLKDAWWRALKGGEGRGEAAQFWEADKKES